MKMFPLFFVATSLFAASPTIYMAPPSNIPTAPVAGKESKVGEKQSQAEKIAGTRGSAGAKEVMIISPEGRANDIKSAIDFLKKNAPTTKPNLKMANGASLTGILEVDVMPGGTVLIFKVASLKGVQYRIENIENIASIEVNDT